MATQHHDLPSRATMLSADGCRRAIAGVALLAAALTGCGTEPEAVSGSPGPGAGPDAGHDAGAHVADVADPGEAEDASSGADGAAAHDAGGGALEPLRSCEVEAAWLNEAMAQWMEPAVFEASPNGGLVWAGHFDQWQGSLTRAFDGEVLAVSDGRPGVSLDAAWQRRAVLSSDSRVEVRTTVTDELIATLAEPTEDWSRAWLEVELSDDGRLAAAAGCDGEAFRLGVWEVDPRPRVLADLAFPVTQPCRIYQYRPQIRIAGEVVFVAGGAAPHLMRWDFRTGERIEATDWPASDEPSGLDWTPTVLSLDLSPDGRRVAAVGTDGTLRLMDARTLRTLAQADVATNMLNENTYAPWITTSPVAFSPRGSLLAALGGETAAPGSAETPRRSLLLLDAETLDPVREVPLLREEEPEHAWGTRNAVASLAFARDGRAVYVQSMWGIGAFSCEGAAPRSAPTPGVLDVHLDGPSSVRVGETVSFTATHLGNVGVHAHRFVVDGERIGFGSFERTQTVLFETPGAHVVRVEIEDGAGVGSAELVVTAR